MSTTPEQLAEQAYPFVKSKSGNEGLQKLANDTVKDLREVFIAGYKACQQSVVPTEDDDGKAVPLKHYAKLCALLTKKNEEIAALTQKVVEGYEAVSALEKPEQDGWYFVFMEGAEHKRYVLYFNSDKWYNYHQLDFSHWLKKVSLPSSVVPTGMKEDDVTSTNNSSIVPCDAPLKDSNSVGHEDNFYIESFYEWFDKYKWKARTPLEIVIWFETNVLNIYRGFVKDLQEESSMRLAELMLRSEQKPDECDATNA